MKRYFLAGYGLLTAAGLGSSLWRPRPKPETPTTLAAPALAAAALSTLPLAAATPSAPAKIATPGFAKTLLRAARRVARPHGPTYTVRASAYSAVAGQTDPEPFVTADNSTIPRHYSSRLRWLALSRDLLRPWGGPFQFGDTVEVTGLNPHLDGRYEIHDTMARRHRRALDILFHPREKLDLWQPGVKLRRVSKTSRLVAAR